MFPLLRQGLACPLWGRVDRKDTSMVRWVPVPAATWDRNVVRWGLTEVRRAPALQGRKVRRGSVVPVRRVPKAPPVRRGRQVRKAPRVRKVRQARARD